MSYIVSSQIPNTTESGSTANTYVYTTTMPYVLVNGLNITLEIVTGNTGPATVNINGTGAIALKWRGVALSGGELSSGSIILVTYSATNSSYEIISGLGSGALYPIIMTQGGWF